MPNQSRILEIDGSTSLTFYTGELPADPSIIATGHEPNGYFWESMVQYLEPALSEEVELDSEAGMFAAYGRRSALEQLQTLLDGFLDDGHRVAAVIREAEASGFRFND